MSNVRIYGVLRVVDGELCWLDTDGAFGPLCDDSFFAQRRNDAFDAAQKVRGLVCTIDPVLAKAYALSSYVWPHNGGSEASIVVLKPSSAGAQSEPAEGSSAA